MPYLKTQQPEWYP